MTSPVLFELLQASNGKNIAVATLNEEKTLNSLSIEMVELLLEKLLQWQDDDAVAAVFLQASGEKAFCAGGDVQKLYQSSIDNPGGPCDYAENFFAREYRLDYLIHQYSKPIICWGHGIVMGGGLGLMAGCRHRIVTEKTRMAMPEITIALFPDVGGSWFLNRAPGNTGLFLALTAASINAADCLYIDYADYFIVSSSKQDVLDALSTVDFSGDINTDNLRLSEMLQSIAASGISSKPEGNIEHNIDVINQLTSHDTLPDIVEAINAYEGDNKWMLKGAKALAHGSPISACNIFQALRLTEGMSLADVFKFELILATNIVRHPEFSEGVRALLIDKDQSPRWQYQTVNDVPDGLLQQMVTPPWPENPLQDL